MHQMMKPPLNLASMKKKVHKCLGTLLYYARAVDCTMITALNTIAEQNSKTTKHIADSITELLINLLGPGKTQQRGLFEQT